MNEKERQRLILHITSIPIVPLLFGIPAVLLDLPIMLKYTLLTSAFVASLVCGYFACKYQYPLMKRDLAKIRKPN